MSYDYRQEEADAIKEMIGIFIAGFIVVLMIVVIVIMVAAGVRRVASCDQYMDTRSKDVPMRCIAAGGGLKVE